VKEAAIAAILADDNQYSDDWGTPQLRSAVVDEYRRHVGPTMDPHTEVTVTCGSTEAMVVSLMAICEPGDQVILPEPYYENHSQAIRLAGSDIRLVPLESGTWALDADRLAAAFNAQTRAIIINSPQNPTGKVFSPQELEIIAELCQQWDVIAVSDEIYRHLTYDAALHTSISTVAGMRDLTVIIDGLSKSYGVTGWRVGWAMAPSTLASKIRELHTQLTLGAPTPFQTAGVTALTMEDEYYVALRDRYQRSRDLLSSGLLGLNFRHVPPLGAFYLLTEFPTVAREDDDSFSRRLIKDIGVAAVPGGSFFDDPANGAHLVRFSFSKSERQLVEALDRLAAL
jgi:aminotransferase